tara:strand:- start:463 stop:627 length:165 start_codon:yes stop_codon:yes gene_type:complete
MRTEGNGSKARELSEKGYNYLKKEPEKEREPDWKLFNYPEVSSLEMYPGFHFRK